MNSMINRVGYVLFKYETSSICRDGGFGMSCPTCELDVLHLGDLIDERLEDYENEVDKEFIESIEGECCRYRARGKLIAVSQCRKILEAVINDMVKL